MINGTVEIGKYAYTIIFVKNNVIAPIKANQCTVSDELFYECMRMFATPAAYLGIAKRSFQALQSLLVTMSYMSSCSFYCICRVCSYFTARYNLANTCTIDQNSKLYSEDNKKGVTANTLKTRSSDFAEKTFKNKTNTICLCCP